MKKIASYIELLLLLLCDFQMGRVFGTAKCTIEWPFFVEWGIIIFISDHLGSFFYWVLNCQAF